MDVEAYLRRIEYDGPRQPLPSLCATCIASICSPSLSKISTSRWARRSAWRFRSLYHKIVVRRRGGFCYELNGLFGELLRALGFRVEMLSARVRREDGGFGPEFDHMLLKVDLEEPWLVDVGFGDSFVDPIVFHAGGADQVNGHRYVVLPMGEEWQLLREDEKGQVPLYVFRDVPHLLSDYQEMCIFHQTSPESHFTKSWICSRATPEGRITLANMTLIVTREGSREEIVLSTEGDLRRCLREAFALEIDQSATLSELLHS